MKILHEKMIKLHFVHWKVYKTEGNFKQIKDNILCRREVFTD